MNFLGHFHLSDHQPEVLVGNFLGDFVKGRDLSAFDEKVQVGIRLHRYIDEYSDSHPAARQARALLSPLLGHYAPVAVDIYFDHFLARHWQRYSDVDLEDFEQWCYQVLGRGLPASRRRATTVFGYMRKGRWLSGYATKAGLRATFEGMSHRAAFENRLAQSTAISDQAYSQLRALFTEFYPEMLTAAAAQLQALTIRS